MNGSCAEISFDACAFIMIGQAIKGTIRNTREAGWPHQKQH